MEASACYRLFRLAYEERYVGKNYLIELVHEIVPHTTRPKVLNWRYKQRENRSRHEIHHKHQLGNTTTPVSLLPQQYIKCISQMLLTEFTALK